MLVQKNKTATALYRTAVYIGINYINETLGASGIRGFAGMRKVDQLTIYINDFGLYEILHRSVG